MQQTPSAISYYGSRTIPASPYVTPGGRSSSCIYTSPPVIPTSSPRSSRFSGHTRPRRYSDSEKYRYSASYASALPQHGTTGFAPGYAPAYTPAYTPQAQQLPGPYGTPVANTMPVIPSSPYTGTHAYKNLYLTTALPPGQAPFPTNPNTLTASPYMASSDRGIRTLTVPHGYHRNNQPGATDAPYSTDADPRRTPYYQNHRYPVPPPMIASGGRTKRRKRHRSHS